MNTQYKLHFFIFLVEIITTSYHVSFPVSENHMCFSENIKAKNKMEDFQIRGPYHWKSKCLIVSFMIICYSKFSIIRTD